MANHKSLAERFWAKVNKGGPNECWLWTGGLASDGYGRVWDGKKNTTAHRYAYELTYGPIAPGMCACHHCDVRLCANPAHIFIGTRKDNVQDAVWKGRMATGDKHGSHTHPEAVARGSNVWSTRLNEDIVRGIRIMHRKGVSVSAMARRYHVSHSAIGDVVRYVTWKHVAEETTDDH